MRKKFYFATLVIAALSFTGCANDEYVGDQRNLGEQNGAIAFSTKSTNTVRANSEVPTAAGKLNKQFWVYGTKKVGKENKPVFNNYRVYYTGNTNDPYSPKGWEYVGQQVAPAQAQTIKYWDYSASQYDFEAYSKTTGSVARNDAGDYEVTQLSSPKDLYFAEKKTVTKSDNNYKDAVQLNFKSVLSKIRVGFYETIPGYSVKITKFYGPKDTETGTVWATDGDDQKFVAWCPNKKIDDNNNSFVVSYVDVNNGNPAVIPAVTKVKKGDKYQEISGPASADGYKLDQTLTLGGNLITKISTETSTVTWDQDNGAYTYFIPQNAVALCDGDAKQVKEMKIKVDYTLTSDDQSGEVINVTGATAIVPAEYLKWKPNTAYSYVFKISDNTNGSTGGAGGTEGLYPIIFDAVVTEMEKNDYLTTVSDLSITATQDGPFAEANNAVFKTGEAINVKVMRYNNASPDDITDNFYQNADNKFKVAYVENKEYDYTQSINYNLHEQTLSQQTYDTTDKVIKLESKTNAGYWIVEVTYKDGDKTITKYAVLKVETVPTPPSQEGGQG